MLPRSLREFSDEEKSVARVRVLAALRPPTAPDLCNAFDQIAAEHDAFKQIIDGCNATIDRAFDIALTPSKSKHAEVTFPISQELAVFLIFRHLKDPTKISLMPRFSHIARETVLEVRLQWGVSDPTMAARIFGRRLERRLYCGPNGRVNFDPASGLISGGYLTPEIDDVTPLTISYNWSSCEMTVKFWFEKTEAHQRDDGSVEFADSC